MPSPEPMDAITAPTRPRSDRPLRAVGYWAAKLGSEAAEWEDAIGLSERRGRFAVADGATSSYGAGRWARALVRSWLDEPPAAGGADAVDDWVGRTAAAWEGADEPAAATPWYEHEAEGRGAFATFAGLQVAPGPQPSTWTWQCLAVGDCCAFHLRHGDLVSSFPVARAHDFDDEPALLTTVRFGGHHGGRHAVAQRGTARSGDALVLTTDGFATWALARGIKGPEVWALLERIDHERFAELVDRARRRREMANDDVAFVRVELS